MASDPKRVEHDFRLSKLSYDYADGQTIPNKQKYWRISLFFYRKPGIAEEYFARHWHHVHADLVTAAQAYCDNNILRYNQFHQTSEGAKLAKDLGWGIPLDFEAVTEFWVKDVEDFKRFTKSPEFAKHSGDTQNFVNDALGVKVMIGYDNIVYGEAVPGYGNDGVLRRDIEKWHKEHPNAGPA